MKDLEYWKDWIATLIIIWCYMIVFFLVGTMPIIVRHFIKG